MHVLPVLGALERRRRDEPVVVIGVHSAKFDAERHPEGIREAMRRHGVSHPVIVDREHRIWSSYAIRSWPTLVVLRPDGTIAAVAPGEADLEPLDEFVGKLLDEAAAEGTLARERLRLEPRGESESGLLRHPGKVLALPGGGLAVADGGGNRVLLLDAESRIERVIGGGDRGLSDGRFVEAQFDAPRGLAYDAASGRLFVADTGNHALREVDLAQRAVRTLAGNGVLGRGFPTERLPGREIPLRSPWDLALAGDYLLVAMAGAHQIWVLDRRDGTIGVLAGSGQERLQDGRFAEAAFAQPSGLALAGARLYVADSETSAVRYLDLDAGEVKTLVGQGLFEFGDHDGPAEEARLQHPIGIAAGPAGLLVADSFNDKLKRVDPSSGAVATFFAEADGITLKEPSGLCQLEDGRVVVADTNHHRLVRISRDGTEAEVVAIGGRRP